MMPANEQGRTDVGIDVGIDVGATLCKVATSDARGARRFNVFSSLTLDHVATHVRALSPHAIGLTGGGAGALATLLPADCARIAEFDAWCNGYVELSTAFSGVATGSAPLLLVSVGSGTSIFKVQTPRSERVGSTSLGGGTIVGLGSILTGTSDFSELCRLAREGDANGVDLRIQNIYPDDGFALSGALTAAAFGRVARDGAPASAADRAAALMRMIGESIALICAGLCRIYDAHCVLLGGSTLKGNVVLRRTLAGTLLASHRSVEYIPNGEFTGAVGALLGARGAPPSYHRREGL